MSDISDPPIRVVIFDCRGYLQVLNLQVRNIVHGYFEVHGYGTDLLPALSGSRVLESDLGNKSVLNATLELLD